MQALNRLGFFLSMGLSVLLVACSSAPVAVDSKPAAPAATNPPPKPTPPAATPSPVAKTLVAAHLDPASPLSHRKSIYFEFDQSNVSPDYAPILELHGRYLAANPALSIRVEGHTDEQGGSEYNLALGQKRAEAVVSALKIYGVKSTQMEAVSFGEEKPREAGHEEAAYRKNRRADLAYPSK